MAQGNGFRVSIPEALNEDSLGYVTMRHGQQFTLNLHNGHKFGWTPRAADAEVYIQGKHMGTFRLSAGQTLRLERPVNDTGCFTAFKRDTVEAHRAGINADSDDAGLIKVVFRPGVKKSAVRYSPAWIPHSREDGDIFENACSNYYSDGGTIENCSFTSTLDTKSCCAPSSENLVSGGVGLSGYSNQDFVTVDDLIYDEGTTTVYLRLAFREDEPRPLTPVYRPSRHTNYPRPLR